MSNPTTTAPKAAKKYQPTRTEVVKTVIIAVLITGLVAFIGGMQFANKQNAEVNSAVKTAQAQQSNVIATDTVKK